MKKEIELKIETELGIPFNNFQIYEINNFYVVYYLGDKVRLFICDKEGNQRHDIYGISRNYVREPEVLNDNNFFIVLRKQIYHYRIDGDKLEFVRCIETSLNPKISKLKHYINQGVVGINKKLYNFETAKVINKDFDDYIDGEWEIFGEKWGMTQDYLDQFQSIMIEKENKNGIFGVTKTIEANYKNIETEYDILIFINKHGEFVSDLYYVDDMSLTTVKGVTHENFKEVNEQLKFKLIQKINMLVTKKKEEQEKEKQLLQMIKKI